MSAAAGSATGTPRRRAPTWALCGALVLGGAVTPALTAALSPRLAAALAVCDGFTLTTASPSFLGQLTGWTRGPDAWGHQVRIEEPSATPPGAPALRVRSFGPDGRDDQGGGDDLVLTEHELALAAALNVAPLLGVLFAAALAWCLAGPFTRTTRAASAAREVARAAGLAGLPALLVLGAARLATLGPDPIFGDPLARLLDARAVPTLLVSPGWAFVFAYAATAYALAYAWRVTRPRADAEAPPTPP